MYAHYIIYLILCLSFFIIDGVLGSSDERFVGTKHYHSFPKQLRKAGSRTAILRFSDVGVRGVQYGLKAFIKAIFTSSIKIPHTRRNGKAPSHPQRVAVAK